MSSEEDVVLSFHNSLLRESDIHLLRGPYWLNDQLISFYLEYLEHVTYRDNTDLLFVSPEVVQCIKLVSKQEMSIFLEPLQASTKSFIFLPFNDNDEDCAGGCHWSLLVFSRIEQKFFHYDSFNGSNLMHCYKFVRDFAQAIDCPAFDVKSGKCLQQSNNYDCGIHVLCNVDAIARQCTEKGRIEVNKNNAGNSIAAVTPAIIASKRNALLKLINGLKVAK